MSLIFNFFDDLSFKTKIECIDCFCKHFKLNYSDTFVKLLELNHKDIPVWKLAQTLQLDLMQPTFDCEVVCRHVTTCDDQLDSIKKYGFLTLSEVLKKDTPLKKFLLKYGIEIDAEKKKMIIGEKEVDIVEYSEKCDKCYMNENDDKQCFCMFHNELALLHNKLYYDKSEVEFFLRAHDKNIYSYQSILYSPEILFNIGKIINALDKNIDKWKNNNRMKRYILEFTIPFNYLDFNIKHANENYYIDNEEWFRLYGYTYEQYINEEIPVQFYRNIRLVELLYNKYINDNVSYGQCLPDYHISSDMIKVYRCEKLY